MTKPPNKLSQRLCGTVFCLAVLAGVAHSQDPPAKTRVIEIPGMSPALKCEAHRDGFVCRVDLAEMVPFGERIEIKLTTAEPGDWEPATIDVGRYLRADPATLAAWKPGDTTRTLTLAWKFSFDPNLAAVAFEEAKGHFRTAAEQRADMKKLSGDARTGFIEAQIKAQSLDRAKEVLASRDVFLLAPLKAVKIRRAVEGVLRGILTDAELKIVLEVYQRGDVPNIEKALEATAYVQKQAEGEKDKKKKAEKLKSTIDELRNDIELRRKSEGYDPPEAYVAVQDGLQKLERLYQWDAAELLFLETGFLLDPDKSSRWMTQYADLLDVLLQRPRAESAGPMLLTENDIGRVRQESSIRLTSSFCPRLAEKTPDWGFRGAHQVTLQDDVVGSLEWRGQVGGGNRRSAAWLELTAPPGLECVVSRGAADVTTCFVSEPATKRLWLRIAPRSENKSIVFEARISHPDVQGATVRWTSAPVAPVRFPF